MIIRKGFSFCLASATPACPARLTSSLLHAIAGHCLQTIITVTYAYDTPLPQPEGKRIGDDFAGS